MCTSVHRSAGKLVQLKFQPSANVSASFRFDSNYSNQLLGSIWHNWAWPDLTGLDLTGLNQTGPDRTGPDWTGLDYTGPVWNRPERTRLQWIGQDLIGTDWNRLEQIGPDCTRLKQIGTDWNRLEQLDQLEQIGLDLKRTPFDSVHSSTLNKSCWPRSLVRGSISYQWKIIERENTSKSKKNDRNRKEASWEVESKKRYIVPR